MMEIKSKQQIKSLSLNEAELILRKLTYILESGQYLHRDREILLKYKTMLSKQAEIKELECSIDF